MIFSQQKGLNPDDKKLKHGCENIWRNWCWCCQEMDENCSQSGSGGRKGQFEENEIRWIAQIPGGPLTTSQTYPGN